MQKCANLHFAMEAKLLAQTLQRKQEIAHLKREAKITNLYISRSKSAILPIAKKNKYANLHIFEFAILYVVQLAYLKLDSLNVLSMMQHLLNFLASKLHDDKT